MIYGETKETVTGLIDTGNRLREPGSNQPVHVAAAGLMKQLCPAVKGVVDVYKRQGYTYHRAESVWGIWGLRTWLPWERMGNPRQAAGLHLCQH